jgi:catechol 2,3-dioxygenase-like lactoylglutathione lyase family enzyme
VVPSSGRPALSAIFETVLYYATGQEGEIERFYGELLGLRAVSQSPTHFAFRLGDGLLLLFDTGETLTRDDRDMRHGADGRIHTCFSATPEEYERWKQYLPGHGVPLLREITWSNGVRSIYFDDPAGNLLEIAEGDLWPP